MQKYMNAYRCMCVCVNVYACVHVETYVYGTNAICATKVDYGIAEPSPHLWRPELCR